MVVKFGGKGINVMEKKELPQTKTLQCLNLYIYKYSSKSKNIKKSQTFLLNIIYFTLDIKNSIFPNILTILNENLLVVSKFCYTFATEIKNKGFLNTMFNV